MKKIIGKIGLIGATAIMISGCFSEPKPLPQVDYKSCKTNAEFFSKLGLRHNFAVTARGYSYFKTAGRYDWGDLNNYRSEEIDKELKGFCESRGGIYEKEFKKGVGNLNHAKGLSFAQDSKRIHGFIIDRKRCMISGEKIFSIDNSTNVGKEYLTVHDDENENEDVMEYQQERKTL